MRWRRLSDGTLHPAAWAALVLCAAAAVVVVVPGLPAEDRFPPRESTLVFPDVISQKLPGGRLVMAGRPDITRIFEHGWPWTFLRRAIGYSANGGHLYWPSLPQAAGQASQLFAERPLGGRTVGGFEVSWTAPITWELSHSDLSEFDGGALIADILVAVVAVLVITLGCNRWIRRRGGAWRWRIIDFAAVMALTAFCLGYWKWHLDLNRRDAALVQGTQANDPAYRSLFWDYEGPDWLARLVGSRRRLGFLERLRRDRPAVNLQLPRN